jgi:hypothetical protein
MIASCYGLCRKAYELKDATTNHQVFDKDSNTIQSIQRPILLGDKLVLTFFATTMSPFLLPMHIINDINSLQINHQGLDPQAYGRTEKRYLTDYIFS